MIGLRLRVPIACWRKGHARELIETETVPPPATCYGALLALVGETERDRHVGARVTAGMLNEPAISQVLRTVWKIKDRGAGQGNGQNARPDLQQLVLDADLVVWCDSGGERTPGPTLETRVETAMREPERIERFGGWSLGESTHLVNDATLLPSAAPPSTCRAFLLAEDGTTTLPVWVDHVGTAGTRYAVGSLDRIAAAPDIERLPVIEPPEAVARPRGRKR